MERFRRLSRPMALAAALGLVLVAGVAVANAGVSDRDADQPTSLVEAPAAEAEPPVDDGRRAGAAPAAEPIAGVDTAEVTLDNGRAPDASPGAVIAGTDESAVGDVGADDQDDPDAVPLPADPAPEADTDGGGRG